MISKLLCEAMENRRAVSIRTMNQAGPYPFEGLVQELVQGLDGDWIKLSPHDNDGNNEPPFIIRLDCVEWFRVW